MLKMCTSCGLEKSTDDFHKSKSARDGLQRKCKSCNILAVKSWQNENQERLAKRYKSLDKRRIYLQRKSRDYGISIEKLEQLFNEAQGLCTICKKETPVLHIDHDHSTGVVRGLLCQLCNRALGMFKDDIDILESALLYLKRNSTGL